MRNRPLQLDSIYEYRYPNTAVTGTNQSTGHHQGVYTNEAPHHVHVRQATKMTTPTITNQHTPPDWLVQQ